MQVRNMNWSIYSIYNRCAHAYFLKYVEHVQVDYVPFYTFGTLVHKAISLFTKNKLLYSEASLLAALDDAVRETPNSYSHQKRAAEVLARWFDRVKDEPDFNDGKRILNETPFKEDFDLGFPVSGAIDAGFIYNDVFYIIDYKTNKEIPPLEEIQYSFQGAVYTAYVKRRYPTMKVRVIWDYILHRRVVMEYTDDFIATIFRGFTTTYDKIIQDNAHLPIVSIDNCRWCDVKAHCVEYQKQFPPKKEGNNARREE